MAVLMTVFTVTAGATGVGFYFSGGYGTADYDLEYDHDRDYSFDSDTNTQGFGFILDTAVLRNSVFNYRLTAGYEEVEYDDSYAVLDRLALSHTFGFALVRTPFMRVWMGPQIRMTYTYGSDDYIDYRHIYGMGFGFNMGTNFALGRVAVMSLDMGYRTLGQFGSFRDYYYEEDARGDFVGWEAEAFFKMSFLFRTGEYWHR